MDGEKAFAMATRGMLADSSAVARALAALSEEIVASNMRAVRRTMELSVMMASGERSWPGLLQAMQDATTDGMTDARRIGELALAASRASAHPITQFLPDVAPPAAAGR